jgi:hypothetical protein
VVETPVTPPAGSRCYYCTGSIPAQALNCPACGKERHELYSIRSNLRLVHVIIPVLFGVIEIPLIIWGVSHRWVTGDLRSSSFSPEKMTTDVIFWIIVFSSLIGLVLHISLQVYYVRCYERLIGKKMEGWERW